MAEFIQDKLLWFSTICTSIGTSWKFSWLALRCPIDKLWLDKFGLWVTRLTTVCFSSTLLPFCASYCAFFLLPNLCCSMFYLLSTDKQFLGTKFIQECLFAFNRQDFSYQIHFQFRHVPWQHTSLFSLFYGHWLYVLKTFPNSGLALHQESSLVTGTKWNLINIPKSQSFFFF